MSLPIMARHPHWDHVPYSPHNPDNIRNTLAKLTGKPRDLIESWQKVTEPKEGCQPGDMVVVFKAEASLPPIVVPKKDFETAIHL